MRFTAFIPAFLASTLVAASPEIDAILESLDEGEAHVFKRDAVLSARDFALAERNGVDLGDMYIHSIVKRNDGDHVTIWVAKNYIEDVEDDEDEELDNDQLDDDQLEKRQKLQIWATDKYSNGRHSLDTYCARRQRQGDTGPNAPFTGGAYAIVNWGNSCGNGKWTFNRQNAGESWNLVVAGTNSGANMRFTITSVHHIADDIFVTVGCRDVRDMTRVSVENYARFYDGRERLRARGSFACFADKIISIPGKLPVISLGDHGFNWYIDRSSHTLP